MANTHDIASIKKPVHSAAKKELSPMPGTNFAASQIINASSKIIPAPNVKSTNGSVKTISIGFSIKFKNHISKTRAKNENGFAKSTALPVVSFAIKSAMEIMPQPFQKPKFTRLVIFTL